MPSLHTCNKPRKATACLPQRFRWEKSRRWEKGVCFGVWQNQPSLQSGLSGSHGKWRKNSPWRENRSHHWKHRHPQNREASQSQVHGLLCCTGVDRKWAVCGGTAVNWDLERSSQDPNCSLLCSLDRCILGQGEESGPRSFSAWPGHHSSVFYVYVLFRLLL